MMGETVKSAKWRVEERSKRTTTQTHETGLHDARYTLSQCHVRHCLTCVQTRENVTCEGVLFTSLVWRCDRGFPGKKSICSFSRRTTLEFVVHMFGNNDGGGRLHWKFLSFIEFFFVLSSHGMKRPQAETVRSLRRHDWVLAENRSISLGCMRWATPQSSHARVKKIVSKNIEELPDLCRPSAWNTPHGRRLFGTKNS